MARTIKAGREKMAESYSMFGRFFRNRGTGELAIVEFPNLPLAIFLVATGLRLLIHPHGTVATAMSVVAGAGLVWWSVDEIARGDSPFRRVLGGAVLASFLLGLLM